MMATMPLSLQATSNAPSAHLPVPKRIVSGARRVSGPSLNTSEWRLLHRFGAGFADHFVLRAGGAGAADRADQLDRKSTRLNSSHSSISYAVFCLKKKKKKQSIHHH